jgi:hypothetical protein
MGFWDSVSGFFSNLGYTFGWGAKTVLSPLNRVIGKVGAFIPEFGPAIAAGSQQAQAWIDRLGGLYQPDEKARIIDQTRKIQFRFAHLAEEPVSKELQASFDEQKKMFGSSVPTSREDLARIREGVNNRGSS